MARPTGTLDPKLSAILVGRATRPRLLAYCRQRYLEWFGVPWDRATGALLLGVDEIDLGDPLVRITRPPTLRGRHEPSRRTSLEAAERRRRREARADVGHAIREVVKANRAARAALSRLRSAARDAASAVERWHDEFLVEAEDGAGDYEAALEAGLDVVARLLASLPDDLDAARPPRRREPRTLLAERAPRVFDRELAPRELAVVGVLAGVAVKPLRGDMVATVLERERVNYAQIAARARRAR